ncbi:Chromodomain helicase DNA binding protein [Mesorhizobium sp. ORS 3324]|nr:Chromodomain helicase DNA binding protein [Mesorhizobium sp. ORS 3324]
MNKRESRPGQKFQVDQFRKAARKLETDFSEENFNRVLKKMVKGAQPKEKAPPSPKDGKAKKAGNGR